MYEYLKKPKKNSTNVPNEFYSPSRGSNQGIIFRM